MKFNDNTKLTLISVSDFLATTMRREIKITRTVNGRAAYVVKGKRKEYYFDLKPDVLVFEGWSLPVKVDTDTNQFEGNACYNFIIGGSVTKFKQYLIDKNINETFNNWRAINYQLENLRGANSIQLFTEAEITNITKP